MRSTLYLACAAALLAAPLARAETGDVGLLTLGEDVALEQMAGMRGGEGTHVTDNMDLTAHLYDNVTTNAVTGDNIVSHDSLSNTSGFATVIQNSGDNVIIQNATILNLNVQ